MSVLQENVFANGRWSFARKIKKTSHKRNESTNYNCYIAGNVFATARTLIGYFEVT